MFYDISVIPTEFNNLANNDGNDNTTVVRYLVSSRVEAQEHNMYYGVLLVKTSQNKI